jgi:hypothetical protein
VTVEVGGQLLKFDPVGMLPGLEPAAEDLTVFSHKSELTFLSAVYTQGFRRDFSSPVRGEIYVETVSLLILQAPEERPIWAGQSAISLRRSLKIIVGRFFLQIARP